MGFEMALNADLIAARALIDSPEKLRAVGVFGAIYAAVPIKDQYVAAWHLHLPASMACDDFRDISHSDIMSHFDRAIVRSELRAP